MLDFPYRHRSAIDPEPFCKGFLRKTGRFTNSLYSVPVAGRQERGVVVKKKRYVDFERFGKLFGDRVIDVLLTCLVVLQFSHGDAGQLTQAVAAHIPQFTVITKPACGSFIPTAKLEFVFQVDQALAFVKDEKSCVIWSGIGLSMQLWHGTKQPSS